MSLESSITVLLILSTTVFSVIISLLLSATTETSPTTVSWFPNSTNSFKVSAKELSLLISFSKLLIFSSILSITSELEVGKLFKIFSSTIGVEDISSTVFSVITSLLLSATIGTSPTIVSWFPNLANSFIVLANELSSLIFSKLLIFSSIVSITESSKIEDDSSIRFSFIIFSIFSVIPEILLIGSSLTP